MPFAAVEQDQIRQPSKPFPAVLILKIALEAAREHLVHRGVVVLPVRGFDAELFVCGFERRAVFKYNHRADN